MITFMDIRVADVHFYKKFIKKVLIF